MRHVPAFYLIFTMLILSGLWACNANQGPQTTTHYLFHPQKEELDLNGSVFMLNGGIMVLMQNGPLKEIPTILIPANDSAGKTLRSYYNERMDMSYKGQQPWVKVAGNFIREDSLSPIFKFTWVEFLEKADEIKQVQQLEE
jgi:hypothetical protein